VTGTLMRIGARAGALALLIVLFAAVAALFASEDATRWIGVVGFATVMSVVGWWASGDAHRVDANTGLRDWLVVAFVIGVGWWAALTLYEGEREVVERLGIDFWSVMATVGLLFAAALLGTLVGRGRISAAPTGRSTAARDH
jgi:hypothetical protein